MYCLMCGKEKSTGFLNDIIFGDDPLCVECRSKWKRMNHTFQIDGISAFSPYLYEDEFSHCLIQFKECGDEALKDVFLFDMQKEFKKKYRGYTLCLMPSSTLKEARGFSHLQKMFECLKMDILLPFEKVEDSSQKHLSSARRMDMIHGIRLKEQIVLPKKILLCDDTITTGSTIRGALSCLDKDKHNIQVFSISINKSWITKKDGFSLSTFRKHFFRTELKHHKTQKS